MCQCRKFYTPSPRSLLAAREKTSFWPTATRRSIRPSSVRACLSPSPLCRSPALYACSSCILASRVSSHPAPSLPAPSVPACLPPIWASEQPCTSATSERADRSEQTKTSLEQQTETRRATGEAKEPAKLYIMATHEAFLGALAAFEQRRAYFNLQGDALVPVGSAAFVVSPRAAGWGLLEKPGLSRICVWRSACAT